MCANQEPRRGSLFKDAGLLFYSTSFSFLCALCVLCGLIFLPLSFCLFSAVKSALPILPQLLIHSFDYPKPKIPKIRSHIHSLHDALSRYHLTSRHIEENDICSAGRRNFVLLSHAGSVISGTEESRLNKSVHYVNETQAICLFHLIGPDRIDDCLLIDVRLRN